MNTAPVDPVRRDTKRIRHGGGPAQRCRFCKLMGASLPRPLRLPRPKMHPRRLSPCFPQTPLHTPSPFVSSTRPPPKKDPWHSGRAFRAPPPTRYKPAPRLPPLAPRSSNSAVRSHNLSQGMCFTWPNPLRSAEQALYYGLSCHAPPCPRPLRGHISRGQSRFRAPPRRRPAASSPTCASPRRRCPARKPRRRSLAV